MKTIVLGVMLLLIISMLFFGCTQTSEQKITNDSEASDAIIDVGTDVSGITQSLNEINDTFTDTNNP